MNKTSIEWTEVTWNPITGCTKVSLGCQNCYAERMAKRLKAMKNPRYKNGFKVTIHRDLFEQPLKYKSPRMIFVNSMSDLFHEDVDENTIKDLFQIMNNAKQHTFQILTKRAERLLSLDKKLSWSENIWMGVSVEDKETLSRIDYLRKTNAMTKFISFEPLLEDLESVDLTNIDWAIVGGESGPKSRPMKKEWVVNIKEQCATSNVKFYFKQWGGTRKKANGRKLDGIEYLEMP